MAILTEEELQEALAQHPGWRREGGALVREHLFRDYTEALAYLERVGSAAEDWFRHPDIAVVDGNRVRLTIANANNAGLTDAELRLAAKVDQAEAAADLPRPEADPTPAGGVAVSGPTGLAAFPPPVGDDARTGEQAAGTLPGGPDLREADAPDGGEAAAAGSGEEHDSGARLGPVPLPDPSAAAGVARTSGPVIPVAVFALAVGGVLGALLARRR